MKNEGMLDRILRIILGVIFFVVAVSFSSGIASVVFYILAVAMLITGAIGFCGLYKLLGINTIKK